MPRIQTIDPQTATGKTKELLENVQVRLGMTPNIVKTMANSETVLEAYLRFRGTLAEGRLPAKLQEQIALTVSQANECGYCLAAHSAMGKGEGLNEQDVQDSRLGVLPNSKVETVLKFVQQVVEQRGKVSDDDFNRVRKAGYSDGEIIEIVANVAINIFRNYLNQVSGTAMDFPAVPEPVNR